MAGVVMARTGAGMAWMTMGVSRIRSGLETDPRQNSNTKSDVKQHSEGGKRKMLSLGERRREVFCRFQ